MSVSVSRRPWGLYLYAAAFFAFLYGPVLLLPVFSVNDSTEITLPIRSLTMHWYEELLQDDAMIAALGHSAAVAIAVSVLSTMLGVSSAWALSRRNLPAGRAILGFMMLPLVMPGLILGVSLLTLAGLLGVSLSLVTVAAGHLILCVPFSLAVMMSCFQGFDRSLEEASRDLGEAPAATFWRVVLPIAAPAVMSSLLMTFTISFDEFLLSFFLSGSQVTLPVYLWAQLRFPLKLPSVMALATLILVFSFVLVALAEYLRRRGSRGREAGLP